MCDSKALIRKWRLVSTNESVGNIKWVFSRVGGHYGFIMCLVYLTVVNGLCVPSDLKLMWELHWGNDGTGRVVNWLGILTLNVDEDKKLSK